MSACDRGRRRRFTALGCGLALAAAGCVSGPAPKDHFYRLEVAAPGSGTGPPRLAGTLAVNRFRADALTNERQLLYRESDDATEVGRLAYDRWVDSPTVMLQGVITRYLRAAGVAQRVVTPAVRVRPDFLLTGRIVRLEWVLGAAPRASVALELSITRLADGKLLVFESYREETKLGGAEVAQAIRGFDQALGAIFARFLADIPAAPHAGRS